MHKILILNNDLELGGIQKSLIDFLEYLTSRGGYEIHLVLWQKGGVLRKKIPASVNVIELAHVKTWDFITKEKSLIKKVELLAKYLKFNFYARMIKKPWLFYSKIKQHYNTVISYSQNGYPRFFAIDNVSADNKYLWYHHGSYESTGAVYKLDKEYYGKFNSLVTVSSANKQMLIQYFPEFSDKFVVIPNIINVNEVISNANQEISDYSHTESIFNFVTVSRFSKEKGIDLAIDIATQLKKQGLKFRWYFIGDGDTFVEIASAIKQRNIGDICVLLGSKENPYPYMKLANLYIQTSYVESQSITIYEALTLKRLIVTTDLPALKDALQNGKLGVLCEPDAIKFAQKIINILNDNAAQTKLKEAVEKYNVSNDIAYQSINELLQI